MKTFSITTAFMLLGVTGLMRAASCCHQPEDTASLLSAPLPGDSLYQQTSIWTNDQGKPVTLADGRGRVRVITLFYTDCTNACPLILAKLQQADAALPEAVQAQVEYVLVSFDPLTDTPAKLHAYRESRHLDTARWQLLTGRPSDVRELSALLNVRYKAVANGTIEHSNLVSVLSSDGAIVYQETGTTLANSKLAAQIAAIVQTAH